MSRLAQALLIALMATAAPSHARQSMRVALSCSPDGRTLGIATTDGKIEWKGDAISAEDVHRLLPDRNAPVMLTSSVETPYRCIGGVIYSLQRLGYRRIGFIAEPPPVKR